MKIDIVGFDPSFANFGIAFASYDLDSCEIEVTGLHLIETKKRSGKQVRVNSDDLRRGRELQRGMTVACKGRSIAMCEVPSGTQSARASWALGATLGVLTSCPIPLVELTPKEVKLASVGTPNASKDEMIEWARELHPHAGWLTRKVKSRVEILNKNEHLADAVAVLYAGVQTEQFAAATAMMRSMGVAAS